MRTPPLVVEMRVALRFLTWGFWLLAWEWVKRSPGLAVYQDGKTREKNWEGRTGSWRPSPGNACRLLWSLEEKTERAGLLWPVTVTRAVPRSPVLRYLVCGDGGREAWLRGCGLHRLSKGAAFPCPPCSPDSSLEFLEMRFFSGDAGEPGAVCGAGPSS